MPKIQDQSAAAKRFRKTASGKYKCSHANKSHILTKKATKRKRNLQQTNHVRAEDADRLTAFRICEEIRQWHRSSVVVTARRRHKKVPEGREGYYNARRKVFRVAKRKGGHKAQQYAYISRKQKAPFPHSVDRPHQRGGPCERHELQPFHERPAEGRHHPGPQGAGGHRRARRGGFCGP